MAIALSELLDEKQWAAYIDLFTTLEGWARG